MHHRYPTLLTLLLLISLGSALAQSKPAKPKTGSTNPSTTTTSPATPTTTPAETPAPAPVFRETPDTVIENRLVALALAGPEYKASGHQSKINELELQKARGTWLNLLSLSANYNDQTFAKQTVSTNGTSPTLVYPKYFFGINIPLGIIISQRNLVRSAKETIAYGHDQQESLARKIKADVLSKYKQYKLYSSLLAMQSEMINDVLANAAQAEASFRKGSITVETYIASQRLKNDEMAKNMNLKLQQDLIRLEIERMIGVSLDEVLHP
jgi:outer membrane protein TolC